MHRPNLPVTLAGTGPHMFVSTLILDFTKGVEPLFSTIEPREANGASVSTGQPHVAPDNNRRMTIELPELPPGTYTVIWHATSVDTHKTEGSCQFTVSR